jgi:hypothetical protein
MYVEEDSFRGRFVAFFHHGLLLIEDTESTGRHDNWDARTQRVHLDVDSLYVCVQPSVDGPVDVTVFEGQATEPTSTLTEIFAGPLTIHHGSLRLADPTGAIVLEVPTSASGPHRLTVLADDPVHPARLVVTFTTPSN